MASLTKIMTCVIVIEETMKNRRSFHEIVHISESSVNIIGTRAGLQAHDSLKVWDLLHALMLPSGNDAALALSEYVGRMTDQGSPGSAFISKMNSMAKGLKLDMTSFNNPHGLSNVLNTSNAKNLASLVNYALGNMLFRKIVARRNYECMVFGSEGPRKMAWENTNKLLYKGFSGVKTGFTPSAGPCLACCYERTGRKFIVILLNSKTMNSRWTEALRLVKWAIQEG
jgi:D-alanyl-D-alanine carboxypeptidase